MKTKYKKNVITKKLYFKGEFWTPLLGFLFVGISTEIAGVASLLSGLLAINVSHRNII